MIVIEQRSHEDLDAGVYPVAPRSRTLAVRKGSRVKVPRTGYCMVPDFASTAHMIQGASLDAVFADCVNQSLDDAGAEEHQITA